MLRYEGVFVWWLMFLSVLPLIIASDPALGMSDEFGEAIIDFSEDEVKFKIDTAKLTIRKHGLGNNTSLTIWSLSDNCFNCAYYNVSKIAANNNSTTFLVDTRWPTSIKLTADSMNCSSSTYYFFGERGQYSINFSAEALQKNIYNCSSTFSVDKRPWNSNIPILVAFFVLLAMSIAYAAANWLYKKWSAYSLIAVDDDEDGQPNESNSGNGDSLQPPVIVTASPRERLASVDTFRGLCIVVMIFVNYGGGHYWFFSHSAWNGLTVADLVFPWFMFIMGVNITLSVESLLRKKISNLQILYKVIRRTVILFALGITVINHNTNWSELRIPGVLQRFAIAYLVGFLLQWSFHISSGALDCKALKADNTRKWWYPVRDILLYWPQWLIVICLEVIWLTVTFCVIVPGCPKGYIGPGGLALNSKLFPGPHCTGGAAGYIDRWLFGVNHIYGRPTAKDVYFPQQQGDVPFDPEGLLGTINGCTIVFIGSQMGKIFLYYQEPKSRCIRWLCWGLVLGAISAGLCNASANNGWLPVNKNLWTLTFITTLSSMAFLLMIAIYYFVDVVKLWTGAPLNFVGMNSILLYVGHETYSTVIPFGWGATDFSSHAEWLAMNMLGVFYWVLIAYYCYKIKFFVKI